MITVRDMLFVGEVYPNVQAFEWLEKEALVSLLFGLKQYG